MVTARRRHDWQQTASVMTVIHNSQCTKESSLIQDTSVFMPPDLRTRKRQRKARPLTDAERDDLKKLFPGGKGKGKR